MPKYDKTVAEAYTWAQGYAASSTYLSRLNSDRQRKAHSLWRFCRWAQHTPDMLLALKASFDNLDAERLLDLFVREDVGMPDSQKWSSINTVRGFFKANYRALQPQAGKMEYVVKKPQRCPTKQQRLDLFKAAYNPRDRALVMFAVTTSIALESLSKIRLLHFEQDWQRQDVPLLVLPGQLLKGHGVGKYKGTRQTCFFDAGGEGCVLGLYGMV